MALPITGLKLSDVRLELGLGSTASLQDCFNAASAGGFDPTYATSGVDSLKDFRNYNAGLTSFYIGREQSTTTCWNDATTLAYHDGTEVLPQVGDTVYTDAFGTTPVAGGFGSYWPANLTSTTNALYVLLINAVGEVGSVTSCGPPP
jgi:hypothetical protein